MVEEKETDSADAEHEYQLCNRLQSVVITMMPIGASVRPAAVVQSIVRPNTQTLMWLSNRENKSKRSSFSSTSSATDHHLISSSLLLLTRLSFPFFDELTALFQLRHSRCNRLAVQWQINRQWLLPPSPTSGPRSLCFGNMRDSKFVNNKRMFNLEKGKKRSKSRRAKLEEEDLQAQL